MPFIIVTPKPPVVSQWGQYSGSNNGTVTALGIANGIYRSVGINSTRGVLAFRNTSDSNNGHIGIVSVSGTTPSISGTTTFETTGIAGDRPVVATLDASRIFVGWVRGTTFIGRVMTYSGTSITGGGSETTLSTLNDGNKIRGAKIDTDKVLLSYVNASGNVLETQAVTFSGTTITTNTEATIGNLIGVPGEVVPLTTTTALVSSESSFSSQLWVALMKVNGGTVTFVSNVQVSSTMKVGSYSTITKIDGTRALVVYIDTSNNGRAAVVQASGSPLTTLSVGSTVTLDTNLLAAASGTLYGHSATMVDSTRALIAYDDSDNNPGNYANRIANISGTTVSFGSKIITSITAPTSPVDVFQLSINKALYVGNNKAQVIQP